MNGNSEHRPFSEFDDGVRLGDIASLHELATAPISEDSLTRWAGDSLSRNSLLGEIALCTIRWSKLLGQPSSPTFASAFSVVHDCWVVEKLDAGGGVLIDHSGWRTASSGPLLFPGGEDADDYVVPMLIYPQFFWQNRLRVELTSVRWDRPGVDILPHGYKMVVPSEQRFHYLRGWGSPVILDDFQVVAKRARVIP